MHDVEGTLVGAAIGSVSILPTSAVGGLPFKAKVVSIIDADETPDLTYQNYKFIQTEELTALGVAVHPYGAIIYDVNLGQNLADEEVVVEYDGKKYAVPLDKLLFEAVVGEPVYFELIEDEGGGGGGGDTNR